MNDLYWEHGQHSFTQECSDCDRENNLIKEQREADKLTKATMDFFSNLWKGQVMIAKSND